MEFAKGVMDRNTRIGKYEKLARLSQRRDKLQQAQADKARIQQKLEKARRSVKTAKDRWQSWSLEDKRSFIHVATESITLEEIAAGWLKISVQWSSVLGGMLYDFYMWRVSGTLWSDEERDLLRKHYPTAKRVELLNMLPTRSWRAIIGVAWQLRLRRLASPDKLPIPDTMSLSDVDVFEELARVTGEDTIVLDERRVYVHVSQPSVHDTRRRSPNSRFRLPNIASAIRRAAL